MTIVTLLVGVLAALFIFCAPTGAWQDDKSTTMADGYWPSGGAIQDALEEETTIRDAFGGVWVSDDARVKIGITKDGETSPQILETIFSVVERVNKGGGAEIDIVRVEYSWAELIDVRNAIVKINEQNIKYDKTASWPVEAGIKTDLNRVVVHLPVDDKKNTPGHEVALREIAEKYEDRVVYEKYASLAKGQSECNAVSCNSPLRGGVLMEFPLSFTENGICTAGFVVNGVQSHEPYILTAGHCQPDPASIPTWRTDTPQSWNRVIGRVIMPGHNLYYNHVGGVPDIDAMIIHIDDPNYWSPLLAIYKREGAYGSPVGSTPVIWAVQSRNERHTITQYAGSSVGDQVCISGGRLSSEVGAMRGSCGVVREVGLAKMVDDKIVEVNKASYCSMGGDSGSPVYNRNLNEARGIHTANDDGGSECSNEKYFTSVRAIVERFSYVGHAITFH